jgi:hypothetical protein
MTNRQLRGEEKVPLAGGKTMGRAGAASSS